MKRFLLLFLTTLVTFSSIYGNFGGYYRGHQLGVGDFLQVASKNQISLKKERLNFILGQRVSFHGVFWFENTSDKSVAIDLAFPQKTFWEVFENHRRKIETTLYELDPLLKINGEKVSFDDKQFSEYKREMEFGFGNFVLGKSPKNGGVIRLFSKSEAKNKALDYAKHHMAESPSLMPLVLWLKKRITFNPRETHKVEISFTLPWYYEDQIWPYSFRSDLKRYFEYFTETAKTWHGGFVEDFEAKVRYPEDATDHIELSPKGWVNNGKGEAVLKKNNWAPDEGENISFAWKSDYIANRNELCGNSTLYYGDFHWRFLFDGSAKTAWCISPELLKKCHSISFTTCGKRPSDSLKYGCIRGADTPSKMIKGVKIISGFAKNMGLFKQNSRPKKIIFYIKGDGGFWSKYEWKQKFYLEDSLEPQYFEFDKPVDLTKVLHFEIDKIFKGSKYSDVCLSEITPFW